MFPHVLVFLLAFSWSVSALGGELYPGPQDPTKFQQWKTGLDQWKKETLVSVNYSGAIYDKYLLWTENSFIQPQLMSHDLAFFSNGEYTVDKYLDGLLEKYGGIDSVLIWPTYPNIGIDNRNQFDLVRSMPKGFAEAVKRFNSRGVRVLLPYNPWDIGTRDEGRPDYTTLAVMAKELGTDGFNGDTMPSVNRSFWQAGLDIDHPLVIEPEGGGDASTLNHTKFGWGYFFNRDGGYDAIPGVSSMKYLESRHQIHVCDRWQRNKIPGPVQLAWFNGIGIETWENVWGFWNGMTPRDAEAIRRVGTLLSGFREFYSHGIWTPHTPDWQGPSGVYASRWDFGGMGTVWNFISRSVSPSTTITLKPSPPVPNALCFDIYHGIELFQGPITFDLPYNSFGCIYCAPRNQIPPSIYQLLATMKKMSKLPLTEFSDSWQLELQKMVKIDPTPIPSSTPNGMVHIFGHKNFLFSVHGIEIEGGDQIGMDVQYPWESVPKREHSTVMSIPNFYMDKYPVTNNDWLYFIKESRYAPKDPYNYLNHWINGAIPNGWGNKPVVWISLEDAREYAIFFKKRLPNEWEWQYAATGGVGNVLYPWGMNWDASRVPVPDTGRVMRGPDDVDAHPRGASSFGIVDLIGNVWQMTNEFYDNHTRTMIVRGGSYYWPQGSGWYFRHGKSSLDEHSKYLLMSPSLDRAGALGFRCVVDSY